MFLMPVGRMLQSCASPRLLPAMKSTVCTTSLNPSTRGSAGAEPRFRAAGQRLYGFSRGTIAQGINVAMPCFVLERGRRKQRIQVEFH